MNMPIMPDGTVGSNAELVVVPWRPKGADPEPSAAVAILACAFTVPRAVVDEHVALYFSRQDGMDRLWALLEIEEEIYDILDLGANVAVSSLLERCQESDVDMWCAVQQPSDGTPRTSSLAMVEALVRAREGQGVPRSSLCEGLLKWPDVRRIVTPIERAAARRALEGKLFRGAPIIMLAAKLKLSPSHSGGNPWAWLCRCPGTSHQLRINAQSGQWGCGYCRRKGYAPELVDFVNDRERVARLGK